MVSFGTSARHRFALGAGVASALLSGLGFLPLFAGPSYEYCLVAGLILPLSAALVCAAGDLHEGAPDWVDIVRSGLTLSAAGCVVALLHGLRVGFCDLPGGLAYFAVGPAAGALVGASLGHCVCALSARLSFGRWVRVLLCVLVPLSTILFSFWRYYSSPIIFAFDHFFGYFAGTLYDTEIDGLMRLVTYRVGSCGWVVAAVGLSALAQVRSLIDLRRQQSRVAIGALGLSVALVMTAKGSALGHYQTDASVRENLGHVLRSRRCEIVYATGILQRDAELFGRECEAHLKSHEAYFELRIETPVTVFVFASADQKAHLMGARNVYIAKPWRREIYVQSSGFPHPVLGHELAHVVTGQFGSGPFLVSGLLGGIIPDPGRIEGFAVAATPPEDDELGLLGWAAAMQRLGTLPPTESIFRLGFLGENSSKAYTAAGAFVTFLHERYGAAVLREWYAGKSLPEITGTSFGDIEAAYLARLSGETLSETELAIASSRFERPAIFGRRCPHEIDEVVATGNQALGDFDLGAAQQAFKKVLALDAADYSAQVGLAHCALRAGDLDAAALAFLQVGQGPVTQLQRAAVTERAGDAALLKGDGARAHELYAQVRGWVLDEDTQRTLELKQLAASSARESSARRAIVALLLGKPTLGTNWFEAGAELSDWASADPQQGIADYLLARNLFSQGRWETAGMHLERAVSREISGVYTRREAQRLRLVLACAVQDLAGAKAAYEGYMGVPNASLSRREGVERFAARCGIATATAQ